MYKEELNQSEQNTNEEECYKFKLTSIFINTNLNLNVCRNIKLSINSMPLFYMIAEDIPFE